MVVWYDSSRDGTIDEYIERCRDMMMPKCFKGPDQYQELINLGYITPNITSIRIMYGLNRGDEFYGVVDGYRLEGVERNVHSGKRGIHDPIKLLSGDVPHFEVDMLNPDPKRVW